MEKEIAIEAKDVYFSYEKEPIISGVSFTIPKGSFTTIIGPNGSGKTTLLKLLLGVISPSKGRISVLGLNPKKVRSKVGYVPQRFSFEKTFPITVSEFLKFSHPECTEKKCADYLSHLGMKKFENETLGNLSGGQLQRVLIVRAMLGDPEILYLDEAITGIDIEGEKSFYDLITHLHKGHHLTTVMISHELSAVYTLADNVICLNKSLVCFGTPEESLSPEVLMKLYGREVGLYHHLKH